MTEENKIETTEIKRECFCQSKGFRKFLVTALGTFVGVFCALSLFAALHKPPMMPHAPFGGPMMRPCHCQAHHFDRHQGPRGDFHRKMKKRDFQKFEKRDFSQNPPIKQEIQK